MSPGHDITKTLLLLLIHILLKIPGPTRSEYLELYPAALEGNWDKAKRVVEEYPEAIRDSITETRDVLHIAFASKHTSFVKEVVRFLTDEDLERINVNGDTALCFAAKLGTVKIAKEMVKKNNRLPLIRSSEERSPLHIAAKLGSRDMTSYLCDVTPFEGLSPDERIEILMATITNDMYGMSHISETVSFGQLIKNSITSFYVLTEILIGHATFDNYQMYCFYGQI